MGDRDHAHIDERGESKNKYSHTGRSTTLTLSLPVVLLFGVLMILLVRKGGMKISHAIVAAFFGFYLASTTLATQINSLDSTIAHLVDSVHP
jgi:hypothetical protein